MNAPRSGFKSAPTPADAVFDGPPDEADRPAAVRAAPADGGADTDDQRTEEPADEPGYGHGV